MGAVVFWTLLGLASVSNTDAESGPATLTAVDHDNTPGHEVAPEALAALPSGGRSA